MSFVPFSCFRDSLTFSNHGLQGGVTDYTEADLGCPIVFFRGLRVIICPPWFTAFQELRDRPFDTSTGSGRLAGCHPQLRLGVLSLRRWRRLPACGVHCQDAGATQTNHEDHEKRTTKGTKRESRKPRKRDFVIPSPFRITNYTKVRVAWAPGPPTRSELVGYASLTHPTPEPPRPRKRDFVVFLSPFVLS